ncbi:MAG: TraK family protein [Betaproteobacteria bacterium]
MKERKKIVGKSLSERITARSSKKTAGRSDLNRGTFLALRNEVKQAIDDGWSVKTIWETLRDEGKISYGYQPFRRYANSLIRAPEKARANVVEGRASGRTDAAPTSQRMGAREKPTRIGEFRFESEPKKEDLL